MRSGSPLTAAVALLLPSLLAALAAAPAPPPAFVFFAHDYARALLYDNNPEQLRARDLADAAPAGVGVAHLQVRGVQGALRAWFELQVSTNFSLGFAVLLVNSGAAPVDVLIEASGFVTGLAGGLPFAHAFNGAGGGANRSVVPPNGSLALLREDFAGAPGDIFSGLVDFTVTGGPVTVSTAAYRDFAAVDARSLVYEGYVTSTDPGNDDEARVVKGVMAASRVVSAPLAFVVNDGNPKNSTLEFAWTPYVAGAFSDEVVVGPSFTSHDNPLANANAVASDMVAVLMPGWGVVNPQGCCDASGLHYNVIYCVAHRVVCADVLNLAALALTRTFLTLSLMTGGKLGHHLQPARVGHARRLCCRESGEHQHNCDRLPRSPCDQALARLAVGFDDSVEPGGLNRLRLRRRGPGHDAGILGAARAGRPGVRRPQARGARLLAARAVARRQGEHTSAHTFYLTH